MKKLLLTPNLFFIVLFSSFAAEIPSFDWAHVIADTNGTSYNYAGAMIVASDGSVYATSIMNPGVYDMDPSSNDSLITITKGRSTVISKYAVNGDFIWARLYETTSDFWTSDIKLDDAGNVYVTGRIAGEIDLDHTDSEDLYDTKSFNSSFLLIKLTADGDQVWTKLIDGIANDNIYSSDIVVNQIQEVYISGNFRGTQDFDSLGTNGGLTAFGDHDIFLMKLDAFGNFLWVKQMGGGSYENNIGMGQTPDGDIILVNSAWGGGDYDPSPNDSILTSTNSSFTTISKYTPNGDFIWGKVMESTNQISPKVFKMDIRGQFYIGGYIYGTADYDLGDSMFTLPNVGSNQFLAKYDAEGELKWATQFGADADIRLRSMDVEVGGANLYLSGEFGSATVDLDPSANSFVLNSSDGTGFVSKLDTNGAFITAWSIDLNFGGEEFVILATGYNDDLYYSSTFLTTMDADPSAGVSTLTTTATGSTLFIQRLGEAEMVNSTIDKRISSNDLIYPNPTSGILSITPPLGSGLSDVIVTDALGNQLASYSFYNDQSTIQLNIEGPAGLYFINFISVDSKLSYKVIKE